MIDLGESDIFKMKVLDAPCSFVRGEFTVLKARNSSSSFVGSWHEYTAGKRSTNTRNNTNKTMGTREEGICCHTVLFSRAMSEATLDFGVDLQNFRHFSRVPSI